MRTPTVTFRESILPIVLSEQRGREGGRERARDERTGQAGFRLEGARAGRAQHANNGNGGGRGGGDAVGRGSETRVSSGAAKKSLDPKEEVGRKGQKMSPTAPWEFHLRVSTSTRTNTDMSDKVTNICIVGKERDVYCIVCLRIEFDM